MTSPNTIPVTGGSAEGSLVHFDNVAVTYPGVKAALTNIDLRIERGEFVSVVGPSGCGKSTLLRLVAGLAAPSEGTVTISTDRIGFVFQDPTLLPWRTVAANVALLSELDGQSRGHRNVEVQAAINLVGLDGYENYLPRHLSGGMKMRVSLARALTLDPEVFLFDEPFGALDEITRQRLGDELLRLSTQRRFTGLFITHSVAEAVYLSTRVIVMSPSPGRILQTFHVPFATPRDPDLRFTAEFAELCGDVSAALHRGTIQ
ncbi:ABC transporter ATP-binding protein [Mycolicibacterium mageritense]|uniref:ABC transporter ATP-binding protein n=1 Tax=Mycolicibacterium mageritense TaxID=53462 RepID=UPI001E3AD385|nr:ABC transporter ATP-binding protein [Mycolicibacterium mageritense]GJJ21431.1 ABC transporter ATP-binding protein [Mycolicibacterium mageritense]